MPTNTLPFVSVVIPTFRSWHETLTCISALENQTYPRHAFEVIVVNNDPDDPFPESIRNVICLNEREAGSYAARNRGIGEACGEILAFTDSDCIPAPEWLSEAVRLITELNADRIAGKIMLSFSRPTLSATDAYQKALAFNQKKLAASGLSVTANMISKRKVFEAVGNFDSKLLSGGDWEWSRRATQAGFNILYGDKVVITHPARSGWSALLKKSRRVNSAAYSQKYFSRIALTVVIRFFKGLFPPLKRGIEIWRHPDLTMNEKLMAWLVCYALKIHSHGVRILAEMRIIKPTRS